jgi:SNF2 family DNA or RNA helicase
VVVAPRRQCPYTGGDLLLPTSAPDREPMYATVPNDYATRLIALRERLRLTQSELAEHLGVAFATVNRWENGRTKPSADNWERIGDLERSGVIESGGGRAPVPLQDSGSLSQPALDFSGDPHAARVIVEGERLSSGYTTSPAFATEIARIEPLPHQRIAVYERMLRQPRLRFLLADDPGAGKTVMTGLYIREMLARRLLRRVLVVPPAGLVGNWRREMANLFELDLRIVTGAALRRGNPFASPDSDMVVVSVDTLYRSRAVEALRDAATEPYDLVVFDEAHKLTVRETVDGQMDRTERYRIAEALAGVPLLDPDWALPWSARHLLLLTATPHMGHDFPYFGLWRLLDPEVFATPEAFERYPAEAKAKYFLRRTKEEMVHLDGSPVYPPRIPATLEFELSGAESGLYRAVTSYMRQQYNRAKILNRSAAQLAMTVFQRRLTSSTFALSRSLERRAEKLAALIEDIRAGRLNEEDLRRRQQRLDRELDDPFEKKTADEESTEGEREEHEVEEDRALEGVIAQSLAELESEHATVLELHSMARAVLDDGYDAKFAKLAEYLRDPRYSGEKLIIFTEHKDTLEFLVNRLGGIGFADQITQIHGGMQYTERDRAADTFRAPASNGGALLLVGTDAAGEGINLQVCWRMVNYDVPWNPARLEQRMGRIHRYGQRHDFVSVINLIAADTREGKVLKALLGKLNSIREAFQQQGLPAGKVFDVIGRVFRGVSITDYMTGLMTGDVDEATVEREIGRLATEHNFRAAIEAEQRQFGRSDEVRERLPGLRSEIERERLRELLPGYVLRYLREAMPLLGLEPPPADGAPFPIQATRPGALDPLIDALDHYPAHARSRASVHRPGPDTPDGIWLRPGEPLFEAIRALANARFGEVALRGSVFVDPAASAPYFLHIGVAGVERKPDGNNQKAGVALEHRLVALKSCDDEGFSELRVERLLVLRGANRMPVAFQHLVREAPLSVVRARLALDQASETLAEAHRALRRESLDERKRLLSTGYDHQLARLAMQRSRLRQTSKSNGSALERLEDTKERQRALRALREKAIHRLHREIELIGASTPEFIAHLIVVPSIDPDERKRFDAEIEARAMRTAMAYERSRGAQVFDVSTPSRATALGLSEWPGFDMLSRHPRSVCDLAIEVKGRAEGGLIELTENEWSKACNLRERYWLYVVYHCASTVPTLLRIQDPFGKLIGRARTSVCFDEQDIRFAATV